MVIWDQNQNQERDSSLVRYEHLKLSEAVTANIEKVDFVFRVGFLAVMVVKKGKEKGKYWQKDIVEQVTYQGDSQEEQLNAFYETFKHQQ